MVTMASLQELAGSLRESGIRSRLIWDHETGLVHIKCSSWKEDKVMDLVCEMAGIHQSLVIDPTLNWRECLPSKVVIEHKSPVLRWNLILKDVGRHWYLK